MATNLSECHVSNKRTPRALTLPPAKAHPPPKPGRNGRKPKGPVVPLHPSPGPSKAKTQAGRPRPRGVKRAGIKSVWPGPWPPHPPPGPPQATTQAGRPGPRAPHTPPPPTTQVLNYGVWLRVCLGVSFPGAARTRYYTLVSCVSLSGKYTTRYYTQYGFCTRVRKYTPRILFRYFLDTF